MHRTYCQQFFHMDYFFGLKKKEKKKVVSSQWVQLIIQTSWDSFSGSKFPQCCQHHIFIHLHEIGGTVDTEHCLRI